MEAWAPDAFARRVSPAMAKSCHVTRALSNLVISLHIDAPLLVCATQGPGQ